MAFTFEQAASELQEQLPDDRGTKWLIGRLDWVLGGAENMTRKYSAGDPDAPRIHGLLLEQYAHLRDCPVLPGQKPYSRESKLAAVAVAEGFQLATDLPIETVEANWAKIEDNIYPDGQDMVDRMVDRGASQALTE